MTNDEIASLQNVFEMMDNSMSEYKAYELMKVSDIVGKYLPDADYEDIWAKAKEIYEEWENADDMTDMEHGYIQEYAGRYMQVHYGDPDPMNFVNASDSIC